MKVAVVGCSGHRSYILEGLEQMPNARFSGFAAGGAEEHCAGFVERYQQQFSFHVYANYMQLLDEDQPDVLAIASHVDWNGSIVLEALRRGIHVFVEKPVANSMEELIEIRRELADRSLHLAAMLPFRYHPEFYAAYEKIRGGDIGDPVLITAQKSYKKGAVRKRCGSTIPWVGAHAMDWVCWMTGLDASSVYAVTSRAGNNDEEQLDAVAACLLTLDRGATAIVHMDYMRPAAAPTHGDDRIRIVGTKGILELRDRKTSIMVGQASKELPVAEQGSMFCDFLAQVEGKGVCRISAKDSLRVTEICLKAEQSAFENRIVAL